MQKTCFVVLKFGRITRIQLIQILYDVCIRNEVLIMFKKILIAILILNLLGYINYPDEVDRDYYQQTFFGLDRQDNEK